MSAKMDSILSSLLKKGAVALFMGSLAVTGAASANEIKFKTNGGLGWETEDGTASGQFGGRIMVDYNYFDDDIVDHESGAEFRRLRLFGKGKYMDYEAKIQLDFAGQDEVDIKDAYIARKIFGGKITGGHFKQGFGLEELTSSKYITFVERSFPSEGIATSRKLGLAYNWHSEHNTLMFSAYDPEDIDQGDANYDGLGFGGRFTWAPHADKGNVTHFGIAAASEERTDLKVSLRPEAHLGEKTTLLNLVDTTSASGEAQHEIDATKLGLEGALVRGSFSLQAEYQTMNADGPDSVNPANADQTLNSFYVMGSYFLTGDTRPYKNKSGAFDRVKPISKEGAWEVALRYDNAENDDTSAEAEAWTAGLNYYATSHVRYMFNIIKAEMTPDGAPTDEPTVFLARWQLDF